LETTPEDHRIARLAAAAIALSLADSAIPLPLPGIKPGLANIVTLIVLARDGWAQAVSVTALRILASGLLLGHVFSPAFFLSLSGAVASLGVLALVVRLPARVFGPISWSLFAAFAHSAGQLALARLWLIPHDGLFYLVPFFAAAALIFGTLNGLVAAHLLDKTAAPHETRTQNA
jgi:heptaprenyl diphosphate synthase